MLLYSIHLIKLKIYEVVLRKSCPYCTERYLLMRGNAQLLHWNMETPANSLSPVFLWRSPSTNSLKSLILSLARLSNKLLWMVTTDCNASVDWEFVVSSAFLQRLFSSLNHCALLQTLRHERLGITVTKLHKSALVVAFPVMLCRCWRIFMTAGESVCCFWTALIPQGCAWASQRSLKTEMTHCK